MSRLALLIEASEVRGQNFLPGASVDAENFSRYLQSNTGGAWYSHEITVMNSPAKQEVQNAIAGLRGVAYAFIAFSGHGYHAKGDYIEETRVILQDGDEMSVRELNPGNDRNLLILDSCRGVDYITEQKMERMAAFASVDHDIMKSRLLFDYSIGRAEKGQIVLFSCDLDEAAQESARKGGYFSSNIISCGVEWASATRYGQNSVYDCWNAYSCAAAKTTEMNPQQHPQFSGGRRQRFFPFAVKI